MVHVVLRYKTYDIRSVIHTVLGVSKKSIVQELVAIGAGKSFTMHGTSASQGMVQLAFTRVFQLLAEQNAAGKMEMCKYQCFACFRILMVRSTL
jgi:hypothetical protein